MKNNEKKSNFIHVLKAIASGIVWGLGQVFNKQYIKAAFFFFFFAILILIELGTSHIISGYDPYEEQLEGDNFSENFANKTREYYETNYASKMMKIQSFEDFLTEHYKVEEINGKKVITDPFTNDELIEYLALDIHSGSKTKYTRLVDLINNKYIDKEYADDLMPSEDETKINSLISFNGIKTTYLDPLTEKQYYMEIRDPEGESYNVYVNVNDPTEEVRSKDLTNLQALSRNNEIYYDSLTKTKFYIEVKNGNEIVFYENIQNPLEKIQRTDFDLSLYKKLEMESLTGNLMYDNENIYLYFNPEIHEYKETPFTKFFSESLEYTVYSIGSKFDQTDLAKFKLLVYFAIHPEVKASFENDYDNFFYNRAGFFLKGFWGVLTLGTSDKAEYYQISLLSNCIHYDKAGIPIERMTVEGHLSSQILISSLISILLFCYFMIIFAWNVKDAYHSSKLYSETHEREKDLLYFKEVYEKSFEYFVLFPAIFTITFISVMPILFSFLIAFTSYSGQTADVGLFEWVGLKNFANIFVFGGDIPFGQTFWKVFIWTVIWAVFSTITVFFGGFFQALIINSERVPLKKFWRTLFILPWAIPAIITQMVFANIFNENGVVNAFMQNIGLYDVFKNWGILGVNYTDITSGIQKAFYLGYDNIQWFTNPYNKWFVRIVLIVVNIWIGFPYYMALMTGVMTGLDKSLYEAADMDGAGKFQKFKYITFPLVMYSTAPLLVMAFSGNFNNFGMIYFVTQGGSGAGDIATAYAGDTDILISWIYALTVDYKNYNMASVFSILIFLIVGSIAAWNYSRTKAFKED